MASLRWEARAQAPLAVQGSATITLDHLAGFYNHVLVNGLSTTLRLEAAGPDMFRMPEPATVTIAAVQAGVDITDVALRFQLGWQRPAALPWVELRDVSAALLGGKVMSDGLRFEQAEPRHAVTITVEHIDMQQLLQLEQQQGLGGTGVLDGVIPVTTHADRDTSPGWRLGSASARRHTAVSPRPGHCTEARCSAYAVANGLTSSGEFSLYCAQNSGTVCRRWHALSCGTARREEPGLAGRAPGPL